MTDLRRRATGIAGWSLIIISVLGLLASPCQAQSTSITYTYDDAGRLQTAVFEDGSEIAYSLDPAGNRTLVATTGPAVPSVPGVPTFSAIAATTATASWTAATRGVTGYSYTTNGGTTWVPVGLALTTPLTGLTPSTTYTVQIEATNTTGAGPASSGSFTTPAAPLPPGTPGTPTFTNVTPTTATVSWTAASGTVLSYEYSLNGGTSWTNVGSSLTANLSGLTLGTAYTVKVHAVNTAGTGTASSAGFTTPSTYQVTDSSGTVVASAATLYLAGQSCTTINRTLLCTWTVAQRYGSHVVVASIVGTNSACPSGNTAVLVTGYTRPSTTSCEIDATPAVYGH